MASAQAGSVDLETYGKAWPGTQPPKRGDCPFSQRVYLTLEEKQLPYKSTYIEEGPNENKPDYFIEKNPSGLMPVLRDGEKWIQDSEKIIQYLEEKFPEPSLKTPEEFKSVGNNIFPEFMEWIREKKATSEHRQKLEEELTKFDTHLKEHGPYVAGKEVTEHDLDLAPKLRHVRVATGHYYHYAFPLELNSLSDYMSKLESRDSYKKTTYTDQQIIEGWAVKFDLQGPLVSDKDDMDAVELKSAHSMEAGSEAGGMHGFFTGGKK
eukprot:jgi/Chlat1/4242/Chrsp27S00317